MSDPGITLLAKKSHFEITLDSHQDDRKSPGCGSDVQQILRRKERIRVAFLICCSLLLHHHHLHQVVDLKVQF